MAVVKSVSFQPEVLEYGLKVADELFGNNFSVFITFLICSYKKNKTEFKLEYDEDLSEELRECLERMEEVFDNIKF